MFALAAASSVLIAGGIVYACAWLDYHREEIYEWHRYSVNITSEYLIYQQLHGLSDAQSRVAYLRRLQVGVSIDKRDRKGRWYWFTTRGPVPLNFARDHLRNAKDTRYLLPIRHYSEGATYKPTGLECRTYASMIIDELVTVGWVKRETQFERPEWVDKTAYNECMFELDVFNGKMVEVPEGD